MISHIVAYTKNRIIGRDNEMPWHLPADLAHFKKTTYGKPVIMGRKTFLSIGRPLPGRENIVITRDPNFHAEGITIWYDLDGLAAFAESAEEVFLIGGGELFQQTLPLSKRIYATEIDAIIEGDVYYPEIPDDFVCSSETFHPVDPQHSEAFTIKQFDRPLH
ncbi:dihydrofolate reductase [Exiguobacterium sp. 17-1]|uniref:dihydrofolate reductase n=1 Tax=Exiguobacterium sp. 17-1 TaxID=2931981 RepID=UPI001FFF2E59|nr:dihydrofolate reductase [Exiguobacterium sp. 17-1]MCK2157039.1 dihydrofolate reductase [Exiguobacterium sp. 17-1]